MGVTERTSGLAEEKIYILGVKREKKCLWWDFRVYEINPENL